MAKKDYYFYDNKTTDISKIPEETAEMAVGEKGLPKGRQYRRVAGGTVFSEDPGSWKRKQKTNSSKRVKTRKCSCKRK